MRILVAGATGYVGSRLAAELLRDGHCKAMVNALTALAITDHPKAVRTLISTH
jgi:uncharacterized protein YbjT (DUF2867 family)